jgi:hypothetical protein
MHRGRRGVEPPGWKAPPAQKHRRRPAPTESPPASKEASVASGAARSFPPAML